MGGIQSKEKQRGYYLRNREKILARDRDRLLSESPERRVQRLTAMRARGAKWYLENKERTLTRSKSNYIKNRTVRLEQTKLWTKNNPDKFKKACALYRSKNKDLMLARSRDWYQRNLEYNRERKRSENLPPEQIAKRKAYQRLYRKKRPDISIATANKRRARILEVTIDEKGINKWMLDMRGRPFGTCYYCKCVVVPSSMEFDHVIPISRGGAHCLTNLCVSCSFCNGSKHAKSFREWPRKGQMFLSL